MLLPEVKEQEPEIHQAFRDFIYRETGWKLMYFEGAYYGITKERYKVFRAGFKAGQIEEA